MYEVEVKVRADHEDVRSRLEAVGADRLGTVSQTDIYYEHPVRDFAEIDEALRIRREANGDETARITFKGQLVEAESKTRREIETSVGDAEIMAEILAAVGFDEAATVRKTRDRYRLDGFTVSLDTVDGLGTFLEVETSASEADIEAQRERAQSLLDDLGVDPADHIRRSYLELSMSGDNPR